jgi:hypothetical protein
MDHSFGNAALVSDSETNVHVALLFPFRRLQVEIPKQVPAILNGISWFLSVFPDKYRVLRSQHFLAHLIHLISLQYSS